MTILCYILATTLSLASTNEYKFLIPKSTNLIGRTFIPEGSVVPRYEDVAFIREAYAERLSALAYQTNNAFIGHGGLAFESGGLRELILREIMFPTSYGSWPRNRYASGSLVLGNVPFISPDLRQTEATYLWDGTNTDPTNGLAAWVDIASISVPTNELEGAGQLVAIPTTNAFLRAYSVIDRDLRVLTMPDPDLLDVYSFAKSQVDSRHTVNRSPQSYVYSDYTYKDSRGQDVRGTYRTSYVLGPERPDDGPTTNVAPFKSSLLYARATRYRRREFGWRYNDYGSEFKYSINALPGDYEDQSNYLTPFEEFEGNLLAASPALDAKLTNTVEDVVCTVVLRLSVELWERLSWASGRSQTTSRTNYFVFVQSGNAVKTEMRFSPAGEMLTVWDTGVDVLGIIRDMWYGEDWYSWYRNVQAPPVDYSPTQSDSIVQSVSSSGDRRVYMRIKDMRPYFYINRNWNARLENE